MTAPRGTPAADSHEAVALRRWSLPATRTRSTDPLRSIEPAKVVNVFGAARKHHACLLANRRAYPMNVLVHDGIVVWLAARRMNSGKFAWPRDVAGTLKLTHAQRDALVLGLLDLPGQRSGEAGVITLQ